MAVTRINNNQISDASAGNTYVGINAAVKLQDYSITATKIANSLTYGSDLTITGNLTVQGNTTTIDTTYTVIEDPILLLASNQTGSPSVDIGFVGQRGTSNNIAFVWDESADEFVTVYTTTGETNTTINIASYADIHSGNANIGGNAVINGTTSLVGNLIGAVNATGNITGGNLITPGLVTATGTITSSANVTGSNLNTSGQVVATGNITGGNVSTGGLITATGTITSSANVTGANINTAGLISATGNINGGNLNAVNQVRAVTGYFTGNVDVLGNLNATIGVVYANSGIFYGDSVTGNNAAFAGIPGFTQLGSNVVMQFAGNVNSYSQINFQNINSGNLASTDYIATADNGDDSNYYVNLGINSSTFDDPASYPGYSPNDSYVHNHGGNLILNPETAGKEIVFMVGGTDTTDIIATMSNTQLSVTGAVSASGNITGGNLITSGQLSTTGNLSAGNISSSGIISATSNITGGNLATSGTISGTGNVTGGNILTTGLVSATGNISGGNLSITNAINAATISSTGNLFVGGNLTVAGNITYQNVDDLRVEDPVIIMGTGPNGAPLTADDGMDRGIYMEYYKSGAVGNAFVGWDNSTGNMIAATSVNFSANNVVNVLSYGTFQTGNIFAQSSSATGNITGGNVIAETTVSAPSHIGTIVSVSGNVTGGNVITGGLITATGNITSTANVAGGNVIATTTVSAPSHIGTIVSVSGNVTGGNLLTGGLISATANITGGNLVTGGQVSATGNITSAANIAGGNLAITTAITSATLSSSGNVTGGNLITGGLITATGNITSTANVAGGNVIATTTVSAPSHIGTIVSVTGNVTGGNLITGGLITATGNITSAANVVATNLSATGNITGANINTGGSNGLTLNGSNVNSNAGRITINSADIDVDFAVDGDTIANVFYIDAGTGTASFGSSTQTTNAIVAFNASNSILIPVGNTAQRPDTGVTGMMRFNSTLDAVEVYDADSWTTVGVPSFTVITDDQFTGNGSQTVFNLSNAYSTNAVIVSINGVVQIPTSAYSVSSNVLTFTEAPQQGDFIDVRGITTTTQVTAISNGPGNAVVSTNPIVDTVNITGNLIPTANITYNLGSPTSRWNELFLAGNTITLGNTVLKNTGGNTIGFFGPDGTTPATIDPASVDTTTIANGTSNVSVASSGGNVRINIGGTSNVLVVNATGAAITGDLSVTGNATLSGNILGDRVQNGTTSFDIQTQNGNANITVSGTSNVAVFSTAGANITGNLGVTGNITGSYILGNGSLLTGIDATSIQSGTSNVRVLSSGGNVSVGVGGSAILRFTTAGIVNDMGNGVGNIGNATGYFNTAFVKATSAQYADLAENYCADAEYAPGTVLSFGGDYEVTVSAVEEDRRIAGVVSTNPSYIMNSTLECEYVATVALTGRVPTLVTGPVVKGDMMVSAGNGRACACATPAIGTVIGKALENHAGGDGVIEVVVGRL